MSLRVPCNTDSTFADRERDGDVTQLRMLDPREFWQETHAKPRRDEPRHRRYIVALERDFGVNARQVKELIDEDAQTVAALHCDQRLVHQLIQINFLPLGKRMPQWNGGKELLRPEIDPCAVLRRRDGGAEAEIRLSGSDLLCECRRILLVQLDADIGIERAKILQDMRQDIAAERVDEREAELL